MTVDEELATIVASLAARYAAIEARGGSKRTAYFESWRAHMVQAIKLLHGEGHDLKGCVGRWEAAQAAAGLPDRETVLNMR